MKNLLIMRHAKSSWAESGLSDHDRPLNKRGLRDAPQMASWIVEQDLVPDFILSSTANRARTTAALFAENCPGLACEVQTTEAFYHAPATVYLETLMDLPADRETVMFVGHNPGMEDLVERMSGSYERMPTAAIAWFTFAGESWREIPEEQSQLQDIWRPKEVLTF